jgi:hypothetical protein
MAMHRTQQILCFSLIINFVLKVSSLHYLASWPRNAGPCRLLTCFIRPAGRQECSRGCGVQICTLVTVPASSKHVTPWTVIAKSNPPLGLDAQPSNSKSVSFTGRASISSLIVQEHDFLGAHPNHTETINVQRQLLSRQVLSMSPTKT